MTAAETAVTKVRVLRSLMFHTKYFFKKQYNQKFIVGEHHDIISRALELVYCGYIKRLIINIAPRYGKTELAVKSFISHGIGLNPAAKFIHLSYSDDLAKDNSDTVKTLVESVEFRELFPEVELRKDSKAKDRWYTTHAGGVLARAAGGQVTGFGAGAVDTEEDVAQWMAAGESEAVPESVLRDWVYFGIESDLLDLSLERKKKFAGAIVIDDPIKPDDADSDTKRIEVNDKFESTLRNRVNSRNTPIVIIMQRLHPMDLCGYLEREDEQDEWFRIVMPCIKEDGTALWPHKHTVEELKKMEKANERNFQRQFMQNPAPKAGLMFPAQDLNWYDPKEPGLMDALDDPDFCLVAADPANLGGDDFAAGSAKLSSHLGTPRIYITPGMLYNTFGTDYNEPRVREMALAERAGEVIIEGVLGWQETANRIRQELDDRDFQGEFRILRPRSSKEVRIANRQSFIRNNFWFCKDYQDFPQYAKFIRILTSYSKIQEPGKKIKKDDAPDWCEMVADYYEKNFPGLWSG